MNDLSIWFLFGYERKIKLANILGCSRHNIYNLMKAKKNKKNYQMEMNQIEQDEMFNLEKSKQNMIRAAELIAHDDPIIKKRAYFELARWADIYADLNKVMK